MNGQKELGQLLAVSAGLIEERKLREVLVRELRESFQPQQPKELEL